MYYQPFLVRAIAMEPHFWPDIDKKYIELGVPGVVRTGKVISCINEHQRPLVLVLVGGAVRP